VKERDDAPRRETSPRPASHGLCPDCAHARKIVSAKGSLFWKCELARADPRFPRYPPQPRMVCSGFER